jgi:nitrous oxidase accessory protein
MLGENVRKATSVVMFILLLVCIVTFVFNIPIAILQVETTLYVDPSTIQVQVQNDFTVNVNVSDVVNLYVFGCHLGYNTFILDAQTVAVHPPFESPIIVKNETDGYVSVIATLPPGFPKITGSFALFAVTFKTTSPGNSVLNLYNTLLIGEEILPMPHSTIDGSVAVHSSNLLLETDKPVYKLGENITTTITNFSNETILWCGYCPVPWGIFTYPENRCVFEPLVCYCAFELAPGENVTYTWNQSDWFTIGPVEPGMYEVRDNQAWGLSTYFKIVDMVVVPDDYPTIQEAINNANEGDTVYIRMGTYFENVIVNKTISLIGEDKAETIIDGGEINSSIRVSTNNVVISNFTVQNGYWEAVCIWDYSNVTIINNILIHSTFGVRIANGQNNTITDNIILSNGYGIQVAGWPAWSNTIASNTLINNTWGIEIHDVGGSSIIEDNIIISSSTSLHLSNSPGNTVYRNKIVGSSDSGIRLDYSNGNGICENNIIGSSYYSISVVSSSNSYIFHNNFINGTNQVHLADSNNTWDNACEGNYWSNYDGTDLDGDGVGDTELPWEGIDYYPLMNPYWNPGDVNHDLKVDIYDVVRITSVYDSQEGDSNWNPHADIAEPYGIIDIYDVVTCTTSYGKEWNNP